ncbi:cold-shock protein [Nocardia bovistercoris]|uniref:Cold shock domain-containing protein n=1 Tax=Nocardia bovistercoris TaxID=2785916 RepID=A0A931IFA8_9NOCA|nr:cold shock domain-containing protein [Nocardia bovistercoris]MBH0780221.1 cold shock domain-containing protein [Nocardia bovistercoris]
MQGTVKWFDEVKEFGFIAAADGSADLLIEGRDLPEEIRPMLAEGCQVDFEVVVTAKGPTARQVLPVGMRPPAAQPPNADAAAETRARCA